MLRHQVDTLVHELSEFVVDVLGSRTWGLLRAPGDVHPTIAALPADVDVYLEGQPFELVSTFEPELGCHIVRLHVREKPPLRLSTIVGDIAHNLRSALDCVSWRLAIAHAGLETALKERWAIDLSITGTPAAFAKDRVLPFVSDEARAVFERVHPDQRRFMNTADAPLWRIRSLRSGTSPTSTSI